MIFGIEYDGFEHRSGEVEFEEAFGTLYYSDLLIASMYINLNLRLTSVACATNA